MIRDAGTGGMARFGAFWESAGVLAAIVPCGVLAGLYLATGEAGFLVACFALATAAVAILFFRSPKRRLSRRTGGAGGQGGVPLRSRLAGAPRFKALRGALGRTFTRPVLKLLGFAAWMLAWGATAALYARVVSNAQIGGLVILVLVGGFSPVVFYYGLEMGVKKLSRREQERD